MNKLTLFLDLNVMPFDEVIVHLRDFTLHSPRGTEGDISRIAQKFREANLVWIEAIGKNTPKTRDEIAAMFFQYQSWNVNSNEFKAEMRGFCGAPFAQNIGKEAMQ